MIPIIFQSFRKQSLEFVGILFFNPLLSSDFFFNLELIKIEVSNWGVIIN